MAVGALVGTGAGGGESEGDDEDAEAGVDVGEDIPFELVGKVASAGAVAEPGDVESSAASRHY